MIRWSDSLSLGIEEIDRQHKRLIDIVNSFLTLCRTRPGRVAVKTALADLREYTVFHFRSEEAYMEAIGHGRLDAHKLSHAKLVKSLKDFQREMFGGQQVDVAEFKAFIGSWLVDHILKEDMLIKQRTFEA
jgi:hemerythrin